VIADTAAKEQRCHEALKGGEMRPTSGEGKVSPFPLGLSSAPSVGCSASASPGPRLGASRPPTAQRPGA